MRTTLGLAPALESPPIIPPPSIWKHRTVIWITSLLHNNPAHIAKVVLIVSALLATAIYYLFRKPPPAPPGPSGPPMTREEDTPAAQQRVSGGPASPYFIRDDQNRLVPIPYKTTKTSDHPPFKLRRRTCFSPSSASPAASTPLSGRYTSLSSPPSPSGSTNTPSEPPHSPLCSEQHIRLANDGLGIFLRTHQTEEFAKLEKALKDERDNLQIGEEDLPAPVVFLSQGRIRALKWHEIFAVLGYFKHISGEPRDDELKKFLTSDSPTFCDLPVMPFFRDFNTYLASENPWEQAFFKTLKSAFFEAHLRVEKDDSLFDLAYACMDQPILLDLSLGSAHMTHAHASSSPVSPTTRVQISPLEEAHEKWASNPVVQWIICSFRTEILDWGINGIFKDPNNAYLASFLRVIQSLYLNSEVDTRLDLKDLEADMLVYLQPLSTTLKDISIKTSEDEMKKAMDALSEEEKSHIFESYLFINVIDHFVPSLEKANIDWAVKMRTALETLKAHHIELMPKWDVAYETLDDC